MPHALLDLLRMGALGDQEGSAGVPEIVKPEGRRESGADNGRLELATVEVPAQRAALGRGEHEALA